MATGEKRKSRELKSNKEHRQKAYGYKWQVPILNTDSHL